MTTWILLGGPQHGTTGSGEKTVPSGYDFEGEGRNYSPIYPDGTQTSATVYRWATDAQYVRDGQQILANIRDGVYGVPAGLGDLFAANVGVIKESLQFGLSQISAEPSSEGADRTREIIDEYRRRELV